MLLAVSTHNCYKNRQGEEMCKYVAVCTCLSKSICWHNYAFDYTLCDNQSFWHWTVRFHICRAPANFKYDTRKMTFKMKSISAIYIPVKASMLVPHIHQIASLTSKHYQFKITSFIDFATQKTTASILLYTHNKGSYFHLMQNPHFKIWS